MSCRVIEGYGFEIDGDDFTKAAALYANTFRDEFLESIREEAEENSGVRDSTSFSRMEKQDYKVTEEDIRAYMSDPAAAQFVVEDDFFASALAESLNTKYHCNGFYGLGADYDAEIPAIIVYQAVYPWTAEKGDKEMTEEKLADIFSELRKALGNTSEAGFVEFEYDDN